MYKDPIKLLRDTIKEIETDIAGNRLRNTLRPYKPMVEESERQIEEMIEIKKKYEILLRHCERCEMQ